MHVIESFVREGVANRSASFRSQSVHSTDKLNTEILAIAAVFLIVVLICLLALSASNSRPYRKHSFVKTLLYRLFPCFRRSRRLLSVNSGRKGKDKVDPDSIGVEAKCAESEHREQEPSPHIAIPVPPDRFAGNSSSWEPPASIGIICQALANFRPELTDELALKKGDVVTVLEYFEDGWVKVAKAATQRAVDMVFIQAHHGLPAQDCLESKGMVPYCFLKVVSKGR